MRGLVTPRDGRLWLGGEPFRFMGTNCYFLAEEGARELLGWQGYAGRVDEAMEKASALGLGVVRAWAFNDDPDNPAAIQIAPGRYNDAGLRGLDLVVDSAARKGVRLILSLGNYWSDYGGIEQYLAWHGLDPAERHRFFSEPALRDHYGDHIEALLGRVSHISGRRLGEEPAVLGWELLNEPRGTDLDDGGATMIEWVVDMAARVRRAAPRHLVLTGEEGLAADDDFARCTAAVDVASIHLYPESWGWPAEETLERGIAWIEDHAEVAARLGRPLVVGELGLKNRGPFSLPERRDIYQAWMDAAIGHEAVVGACSWSMSTDDRPEDWDDYSWYWRDGTPPHHEGNRYADLHQRWAARLRGGESGEGS